jgi:lysozyme family protein
MTPPQPLPAGQPIPFAQVDSSAGFWPVITNKGCQLSYLDVNGGNIGNPACRFLAERDSGSRYHVGMDLCAEAGNPVVACEDGQIVNFYPFFHSQANEDSFALLIQHPKCVVTYGSLTGDSLRRSGRDIGDFVDAGDVIGFVNTGGNLHFETYQNGTIQNEIWRTEDAMPPDNLLDPTAFLMSLSQTPPLTNSMPVPQPPLAQPSGTDEYEQLFVKCVVSQTRIADIDQIIDRIIPFQSRYQNVAKTLVSSGVPWYLIAIIHSMEEEADLGRFRCNLCNGDPLTSRTVEVPAGRPKQGNPPFPWEDAAVDALTYDQVLTHKDWSIGGILAFLERYNGFGYRKFKINSPYLWSYSNLYTCGKFDIDGHFNPNLVSDQPGGAVLLKRLIARQIITQPLIAV